MSVQSIDRAVDIMSLFSAEATRLGITEIAAALGLSKTTVHGLASTLKARGLLRQDAETRKYSLGMKLFELGAMLTASLKLNRVGQGAVQRLANDTGLNARLAVWERPAMLVALTAFPGMPSPPLNQMGPRVPAHCSAIGKAVLMSLPAADLARWLDAAKLERFTPNTLIDRQALERQLGEFRRQGFAEDNEEFLLGLCCRAAPIKERGVVAGSVSLSAAPEQLAGRDGRELARLLLAAATEISRAMA
ncbi:transcriptional regulator, IclR family [Desulfarculus baarsii DSM 2075]|uniref:Transcriptional regulator, IclR family n=1 Tax=Desulfarculus baarsii (strain ATCC 33931 / DSM 2075 / LMG 7858 / VKM B-1802 / 2st14) TaxID=644282 RepID=E1QF09_DESB2|nr:IclR family transcriptional regulator [Desulfarculus baarsii]ADK84145.1 transcriptional regulator, IclR family [Desulfarculus baarsii DSM 2075]